MSNGTKYIGAIDQGTTSTRFIIFNEKSDIIAVGQKEHKQIYPQPGWCEHDPMEILANTKEVVEIALNKANLAASDLSAIGITNQRETTMVWDKATGLPVYNAIVWHDGRTSDIVHRLERMEIEVDDMDVHDEDVETTNDKRTLITGQNRFRKQAGLPLATYFSISKLMWIFENVEGAKEKALNGDALFGTMDTWLIWCLTGGKDGGLHITDVTNASRTMLMNLESLKWDPLMITKVLLPNGGVSADNVPFLPEIRSSSEVYGKCSWDILKDVPIAGNLGDQQAAFVGQCCFHLGNVKNTYGTGCFLMMNTGNVPVQSKNGLLTTVGFKFGDKETVYALEGSVAVAGALVQWLRDNMGLIKDAPEIEKLALTVEDNGGVYFVPAFAGLFAPYWDTSARGVIAGMTAYCTKAHIARAVLEATAFQSMEVVEAMQNDCRSNQKGATEISKVKVDGGMIANETLMQFQADILNIEVERPVIAETTALGAAYAAGLAVGVYKDLEELEGQWKLDKTWTSTMEDQVRDTTIRSWKKAVQKSLGWVDESEPISKM